MVINALEKNSHNFNLINRQLLVTAALSAIKEFDGTDKSSTIPWLEQVELVAEKCSTNPIDIGIIKLVGIQLRNMITIKCEEGNLTWNRFQQVPTKKIFRCPFCVRHYVKLHENNTRRGGISHTVLS